MNHLPKVTQLQGGRAGTVSGSWVFFPHHHYSTYPASHERGHFLDGDPFTATQGNEVPQNSNCSGGPTRRKLPRQLTTLIPSFWNNRSPSTCPRIESRIILKTTLRPPGGPASAGPPGASCGLLLTLEDTAKSEAADRSLLKKGTQEKNVFSGKSGGWNFQEAEQSDRNRNPSGNPQEAAVLWGRGQRKPVLSGLKSVKEKNPAGAGGRTPWDQQQGPRAVSILL